MGSNDSTPKPVEPAESFNDLMRAAFEPASEQSDGASVLARIEERTGNAPRILLLDPQEESSPPIKPKSTDVGGRAGRYTVLGEIARGGVGVILKARDVDLGRDVAMKVLLDKHQGSGALTDRFVEEAQVGGQLQHPGILPVYELGLLPDQRPYFTMKLIKGKTLGALLKERSDPAENRQALVAIFEKICQAMAYAHARGVVHRDLKPANIMVGSYGELKVIDWGFAKVLPRGGIEDEPTDDSAERISEISIIETVRTAGAGSQSIAGSVMGTPAYMSPEQAMGRVERLDERSDVFSLGAILCEILTGKPPYTGPSGDVILQALQANQADALERLDRCGADKALTSIVKTCLNAARGKRPANAERLAAAVHAYLMSVEERAHKSDLAKVKAEGRANAEHLRAETNRRLAEEEGRRRRLAFVFSSAIAAFAIALAVGGFWWQSAEAEILRERSADLAARLATARESMATARAQSRPDLALWEKAVAAASGARTFADDGEVEADLAEQAKALEKAAVDARDAASTLDRRLRTDERMRADLEALRFGSGDPFASDADDTAYAKLFRRYGLKIEKGEPATLAKEIAASAIAGELAAAIDDWAFVRARTGNAKQRPASELARIALLSDDDAERRLLREAAAKHDIGQLAKFADSPRDSFNATTYHILGLSLGRTGDAKRAVQALEAGLAKFPGDTRLHFDVAYWLTQLPRPRWIESAEHYAVVLSRHPTSMAARNNLGAALVEAGDLERAIGLLTEVANEKGGYARGLLNVAIAKKRAGHEDAVEWVDKAIRVDKRYALAYFHRAEFLEEARKWDQANRAYGKAWKLDRNQEAACSKLVDHKLLAWNTKGAEEIAQAATDRNPDAAWTWHLRGFVLGRSRNWNRAIADIRKSIDMDPNRAQAHADLGAAYFQLTDYRKAKLAYQQALVLDKDNGKLRFDYASTLEQLGEYEEQVRQLQLGAGGPNPEASCLADLATVRLRSGDLAGAIAKAKEAVRIDPRSTDANGLLGSALCYVMTPQEALVEYRRLTSGLPDAARGAAVLAIAQHLVARDEIPEAIELARTVTDASPRGATAYLRLGTWSGLRCTPREIEDLAGELVERELHPGLISAVVKRAADSASARGANEDAVEMYELACQYDEESILALRALGVLYRDLGEQEKALERLSRAREINPQATGLLFQWGFALGQFADDDWDAEEEYEQADLGDDPYLRAFFFAGVGRGLAEAKKTAEGIAFLRKSIRSWDAWAPAYSHLASIHHTRQEFDEAIKVLAKAVAISPGTPSWIQWLGQDLALLHEPQEARARYEKLVGRPAGGLGREFDIGLATGYLIRWRNEDVERLAKRIDLDPTQRWAVANLRGIIAGRAGDYEAARTMLDSALVTWATSPVLLQNSALMNEFLGEFKRASRLYARGAYFSRESDVFLVPRARCELHLGNWDAAAELLTDKTLAPHVFLRTLAAEGKSLGARRAKLLSGKLGSAGSEEEALRWAGVAAYGGNPAVALKYYRKASFPGKDAVRAEHLRTAAFAALQVAGTEANPLRSARAWSDAARWLTEYVDIWQAVRKSDRSVETLNRLRVMYGTLRVHPQCDWLRSEAALENTPKKQRPAWRALRERVLSGHAELLRFR